MRRTHHFLCQLDHPNLSVERIPNATLIGYERDYAELAGYLLQEGPDLIVQGAHLYIVESWRQPPIPTIYALMPHRNPILYLLGAVEVDSQVERVIPLVKAQCAFVGAQRAVPLPPAGETP